MKLKKIVVILIFVSILTQFLSGNFYNKSIAVNNTIDFYKKVETNNDSNNTINVRYSYDYGLTEKSYLQTNANGTISRIEYIRSSNKIIVETYSSEFNYISSVSIPLELSIWGGFFSGEKYNFLVFGQKNLNEDDNVETIRIVKYSKDWKRISCCSIKGNNTFVPFDFGNCRMAETSSQLIIHTCHTMYKTDDGYHHQANTTYRINKENMELLYESYNIMNASYGYVSHSFNQFVTADENYYYTADHGDGYPRSLCLIKHKYEHDGVVNDFYHKSSVVGKADIVKFPGNIGENKTMAMLGGLELGNNNVIVVGTQQNKSGSVEKYGTQNLFISAINKNDITNEFKYDPQRDIYYNPSNESVKIKWLTDYDRDSNIKIGCPEVIKLNNDRFLLIWNQDEQLKMLLFDENLNLLSNVTTINIKLTDCKPIVYNGKVTWYKTNREGKLTFYYIDPNNLSQYENLKEQTIYPVTMSKSQINLVVNQNNSSNAETLSITNISNEIGNVKSIDWKVSPSSNTNIEYNISDSEITKYLKITKNNDKEIIIEPVYADMQNKDFIIKTIVNNGSEAEGYGECRIGLSVSVSNIEIKARHI